MNLGWIWTVSLVAALGGLLFGYDLVVIGGAKPFYEKYFLLSTPFQVGWAMSSALIGCLGGAVLSGALSDRFGRKRPLILAAGLFTLSSLGTASPDRSRPSSLNRMLGGVAIGLASNLSPLYIAEIAPAAIRGKLVSINQLTIVIGILAAQVINWLIAEPVPSGATAGADPRLVEWPDGLAVDVRRDGRPLVPLLRWRCSSSPRVRDGWRRRAHEERCRRILTRSGGPAYAASGAWPRSGRHSPASLPARRFELRELLDPAGSAGRGHRCGAGGVPAVVRDQRDLQLR